MYIRVILPAAISNLRSTHASLCNACQCWCCKSYCKLFRIDSDSVFERFRSRIPINDVNTVHALKKHLVAFLSLKELARKFCLGDFDIKVFRITPKTVGKATTSPSPRTTSGSCNYQACWMAQEAR